MKLWLIFLQTDGVTWLEAAMDNDSTAEGSRWEEEVTRCRELAAEDGYEMRIVSTDVAGVFEQFDTPELKATEASDV